MQTIYLDISNKGVIPCIMAKQSEVGRKFLAVITDNGVPYNIPDNSLLSVWYEGDTDAGNYSSIEEKSAFNIDGNKVTVELVAQMLLKPGNGELCLSITHGSDGGETNTWNIPYFVEYKPGAGSSVPTEYFTALTNAGGLAADQVGFAREQANIAREQANIAKEQANIAKEQAEIAGQYAEEAKTADFGYVKADGTVPMLASLDMNGNQLTNLGSPTSASDAVNLGYFSSNLLPHLGAYGDVDVNIDNNLYGIYTSRSSAPIAINGRNFYNGLILSLVNPYVGGVQIAASLDLGYLAARSRWFTNNWSSWVDIK